MKRLLVLGFLVCVCSTSVAQFTDDPFAGSYVIHDGGGSEIVTIDGSFININRYIKAQELFAEDTLVQLLSWHAGGSISDLDVGDLDGSALEEIVAVWSGSDPLGMVVLQADPARLNIDQENAWKKITQISKTSPARYYPQSYGIWNDVLVKMGNFDSDSLGEIVTAYWAEDGQIELTLYDVSDSLELTELGTIRDQFIAEPPVYGLCEDEAYLFDIENVDFNGDGIDEILLSGRRANEPTGFQIFANIYEYNEESGNLEARISEPVYTQPDTLREIGNFNVTAGNFFSEESEHAVVGLFQYDPYSYRAEQIDTTANILVPFGTDQNLTSITVGNPVYQRQDTIATECYYNRSGTLNAVDISGDGTPELVSAYSYGGELPTCKIYQPQQPLDFTVYADLDTSVGAMIGDVSVGNFSKDSLEDNQYQEMLFPVRENYFRAHTAMYQIRTLSDGSFDRLELLYSDDQLYSTPDMKTGSTLSATIDGDIHLGTPRRYSVTDILHPLVILNAPPVHFDVFDGESYDVCNSYNENVSDFTVQYVKESEQSTEVQTEINRDWSMSASLSAGFSFWGVSVSSHLTQEYGEHFSRVEGSSHTVTVGMLSNAKVEDQIFALTMDYDLWEYPVYGDNQLKGHVLVVNPQIVSRKWFDMKSEDALEYIPNHEPGNILSYRRYPLLSDNPQLIELIKGAYGEYTSFLLYGNSDFLWYLNFEDFTDVQATTTQEFNRDWGASVSGWGAGFSLSGSYSSENIQTQRTTVQNGINIDVHLGSVDMGIGETRYEVTPYAYWARNGALVVDYAVDPELTGPGGEDTWWDAHYGYQPDPAFILPWRYDIEKGDLISEAKKMQTKDIQFSPEDPADGDIITIHSRVHNFSLLPTSGPVGVEFYVGDPDSGGTLIVGEDGTSEVFTNGIIPPRGEMAISLEWQVPEGIGTYPRIFAVIDADNAITEIHENNNKGWNILQKSTGVPSGTVYTGIPVQFNLSQNFPNPFNPTTTIQYTLSEQTHVSLAVYNLLGQRVRTLINEKKPAGRYRVLWNGLNDSGSMVGTGIYFYRIQAGDYVDIKKMVYMK